VAEQPRRLPRWPFIIIALLGVQMIGVLTMMRIAGDDPAFGVEPDYYEKAVKWDSTAAARASADQLGWSIDATLGPVISAGNERELRVTLRDRHGAALNAAAVRAEVFCHARSASRQEAVLTPLTPGEYAARIVAPRAGLYEVRLDIVCNGSRAEVARTIEIAEKAAAR